MVSPGELNHFQELLKFKNISSELMIENVQE